MMKRVVIILFILSTFTCFSQTGLKIAKYSTAALSGVMDGYSQVVLFHYDAFQAQHPGANLGYFAPDVSWNRKYLNGDPSQGPAYIGSTVFLVWTTDFYHLARFGDSFSGVTSLTCNTVDYLDEETFNIKWFILDTAIMFVIRSSASFVVYDIIYK